MKRDTNTNKSARTNADVTGKIEESDAMSNEFETKMNNMQSKMPSIITAEERHLPPAIDVDNASSTSATAELNTDMDMLKVDNTDAPLTTVPIPILGMLQ